MTINQFISFRKAIKNKLKNSQITVAYNGLEALNLIKNNQYDIVLMDVVMPIMDGITATNHVRNLTDENKKNIQYCFNCQCWRKRTIRMLKC
jgi:CheY-like chemotaxis protein